MRSMIYFQFGFAYRAHAIKSKVDILYAVFNVRTIDLNDAHDSINGSMLTTSHNTAGKSLLIKLNVLIVGYACCMMPTVSK